MPVATSYDAQCRVCGKFSDVLLSDSVNVDMLVDTMVRICGTANPKIVIVTQQVDITLGDFCLHALVIGGVEFFTSCQGVGLVANETDSILLLGDLSNVCIHVSPCLL